LPVAAGLAALVVGGEMHLSRYLGFVVPVAMLAAARGWTRLTPAPRAAAVVVIAAAASALPLAAYFAQPSRDSDARPIVRHLEAVPADARVIVAPFFMADVLRFYDRRRSFEGAKTDADLRAHLRPEASGGGPTWIVADYRWPGFDRLGSDPALEPVDLSGRRPPTIRLFRTR
jgi:hypothetical protein